MIISNCSTCEYKIIKHDGNGWCYMFENKPDNLCLTHTEYHGLNMVDLEDIIRLSRISYLNKIHDNI